MTQYVYTEGKRRQLLTKSLIGSGGEADVYQFGQGTALKLYRPADNPAYAANPAERQAAEQRALEIQRKLPAFPSNLPGRVMSPLAIAYDQPQNGKIIGYAMKLIENAEVLMSLSNRQYREQSGVGGNQVIDIFRDLHRLVRDIHTAGVVIGDFNDLNVLVDGNDQTYLVDADSMQFGSFVCRTFTSRFVDPLNCRPAELVLARPHNIQSDWYAYLMMLCQSLLYVGPYGGVHKPVVGKRLQHDQRVLKRLTFFDREVLYPKPALPLATLPDNLLQYMQQVVISDKREIFPLRLLDDLRWTHCTACGTMHARSVCPQCAAPGAVRQKVVVRGTVTAVRLLQLSGSARILSATSQRGKLHYLYHENGSFHREDGRRILEGALDPKLRYRIQAERTLIGRGDKLFVITSDGQTERQSTETFRGLPIFDANAEHRYWLQNGQLVRHGRHGSEYIGDILTGQTMFWTGDRFGLGFYQAGQLQRYFTFGSKGRGINDQVAIPYLSGQLIDATCVFSDSQAWFMTVMQDGSRIVNRCYVTDASGAVLANAEAVQGEDSWLAAGIRGHFAAGNVLYAASDEGIARVGIDGGRIVEERSFPDTERFVSSASRLLPSPDGIYAISSQEIVQLKIK